MKLILLRHPPIHAEGRCYGRLDMPLPANVLHAALESLQHLQGLTVYSSPASRCLQLAKQLSPYPIVWPELQELDFGTWEGQLWDDIPRTELDAWAADIWHYQPGGGENAASLRQRWHTACHRLQHTGLSQAVVVSHAGLIRMALVEAGYLDESQRWFAPIAHATPYVLELEPQANLSCG